MNEQTVDELELLALSTMAARDAEKRRVGDRLGAFAVLLPAESPGRVAMAVDEAVADALRGRFPQAEQLTDDSTPDDLDLLIVDGRRADVRRLFESVADHGVVATIGNQGPYRVYPSTEHPQHVWRRGWPVPAVVGLRPQLRRTAGLWLSSLRGVPRLSVSRSGRASLADLIADELRTVMGERPRLVGINTAGHTILHFRGRQDVAVRLSCTDPESEVMRSNQVVADVPEISDLVPHEIAHGRTCGHPWVAMPWVPGRRRLLRDAWRSPRDTWPVAEQMAASLSSAPTGRTHPGWAEQWVEPATLIPTSTQNLFVRALDPLESGLPTGWCHGDPWPGNVLLDGTTATVIDWDNAARDAPLGLDWLLIAALRSSIADAAPISQCFVQLVDEPGRVDRSVGGRPWAAWDRQHRISLVVAAFVLYLRNRALHDLGASALAANLWTMQQLIDGPEPGSPSDDAPTPEMSEASEASGRAARGVLWLGLGAGVSKAAQTIVLLVLAALLEPSAMGVLAIGALVMNVTSSVTDLGSSTALVYWRGDPGRAARSALTVALSLALALVGATWVLAPSLADALSAGPDGAGVVRGLMLALPFLAVAGISQELMRRDLDFGRRVLPDILSAVVGAAVALALAFTGHGVYSLVVGQVVQAVVVMLLCWAMRRPVVPGWRLHDVRVLLSYGGNVAGSGILVLLMLNVDYLFVARQLGPDQLGQYSIAFRLAYMPVILGAVVIAGAAFPYLCRLDRDSVGDTVQRLVTAVVTVLLPIHLGILLLAPQLELLGTKWAPAVPALRWLAVYGLLLGVVRLLQTVMNAIGRPRDAFAISGLHLVLLVMLLAVTTERGIDWVGGAQVAAALIVLVACGTVVGHQVIVTDRRRLARALLPCMVGAASMTLTVWVIQSLLPATRVSVPGLVLVGSAAVAAYTVPVWLLARDALTTQLRVLAGRS